MADHDVAIVGFGPVGAVAACLLGQAGLRVLVLDRTDSIYDKPRAVALDHEIARVLQGIGLGDAVAANAEPFTDSVFFGVGGRVIKRMTMLPEPHPQGWTPSMVFLQPAVEEALRQRAASAGAVEIRLNTAVTGLEQDAGEVRLALSGANGPSTVSARAVIGCDGATSTVRNLVGLPLDDLGFDQPWLVVDVLANERGLAKLPQTSVQYCEPERPTTFVICTGAHRRWELRLLEGEDPRRMETPAEVWRLLSRWITPEDGTLWRSASYRFHALVAREWRQGRVFIAGDAAHQQPPFLGQGLCQGIRDAANLSWKLARVLKGQSRNALLDTYGPERAGHVRKLTTIIKGIGGLIGEQDPDLARIRDDRLIAEAGGTIRPVPRQELMPALDAGAISAVPHPARGTLFPQPWVRTASRKRRMDDVAGGGLRVILAAGMRDILDPETCAGICTTIAALGGKLILFGDAGQILPDAPRLPGAIELVEEGALLQDWFARHGASAAIIRPDNYVFGVAADLASLEALLGEAKACLA